MQRKDFKARYTPPPSTKPTATDPTTTTAAKRQQQLVVAVATLSEITRLECGGDEVNGGLWLRLWDADGDGVVSMDE